jgi:hypothetical protein
LIGTAPVGVTALDPRRSNTSCIRGRKDGCGDNLLRDKLCFQRTANLGFGP